MSAPLLYFTKFHSTAGLLCKTISPDGASGIVKKAAAQFYAGTFETLAIPNSAAALSEALQSFTTSDALSQALSLTGADSGRICTTAKEGGAV